MRRVLAAIAACSVLAGLATSAPVSARQRPEPRNVTAVHPVAVPLPHPDRSPAHAATAHLARISHTLGVDARDLDVSRVVPLSTGATVRFEQRIAGVRALGGYAALTVDDAGSLVSEVVHTVGAPAAAAPTWSRAVATERVLRRVAAASAVPATRLSALALEPVIVDAAVVESVGEGSQFAWLATVGGTPAGQLSALIADGSGAVLWLAATTRAAAPAPLTCDYRDALVDPVANFQLADSYPLCSQSTYTKWRTEGLRDATAEQDMARLDAGLTATLDYYATTLGTTALGVDATGSPTAVDVAGWEYLGNIAPALNFGVNYTADATIKSADSCDGLTDARCTPVIHALISACAGFVPSCSNYPNAFWGTWNSQRCNDPTAPWVDTQSSVCGAMFFGRGWAVDDIIAHELTHGVTSYVMPLLSTAPAGETSNDLSESSALAEAYSDFIAEAVDQTDVKPGEPADRDWKFGEEVLPTFAGQSATYVATYGAFRTIRGSFPGEYKRIGSGWDRSTDEHYNLGPADRFAWLIANGGTQSGYTVAPIGTTPWVDGDQSGLCATTPVDTCTGIRRMSVLVMSALPLMPAPTPTYYDFGRAIVLACSNLVSVGAGGFSPATCTEVRKALLATGILGLKFSSTFTKLGSVKRGTTRTVSAVLKTSTGARAGGVAVKFQMRTSKRAKWKTLTTGETSASGVARFNVTVNRSGYYRVISVKSASVPYVVTPTRWVRAR